MDPFLLEHVPDHVIMRIIQKLKPKEFVRLQRTNKYIHMLCHSRQSIIYWPLEIIRFSVHAAICPEGNGGRRLFYEDVKDSLSPFRIRVEELYYVEYDKNDDLLKEFIQLIKARKITCKHLELLCDVSGREGEIKWCIQAAKPSRLMQRGTFEPSLVSSQKFPISLFSQMESVSIYETDFTNSDLLQLNARFMYFQHTNITAGGINALLLEVFANGRTIEYVALDNLENISATDVVRELPMSLLYNQDRHEDSILKKLDINEMPLNMIGCSYYVMTNPADPDDMFMVEIWPHQVRIQPTWDPEGYLYEIYAGNLCTFVPLYSPQGSVEELNDDDAY